MISTVAVADMASTASVEDNLSVVQTLMEEAASQEIQLVVFPENFAFMGVQDADKSSIAEVYNKGPIQEYMQKLAKHYGIWIIAGTLPLKTTGTRTRSASLVYDDQGICVARYDKIHMFDVQVGAGETYRESLTIEPGNEVIIADTPVGKIGLSVCYDLRFPELYRKMAERGAQIFSIPSAFTAVTGRAHWEILLRARAIENLCYVLAPNQGGTHANGRKTWGHGMIIQPWGEIETEITESPALGVGKIALDELLEIRNKFPCLQHQVFNITG